MLKTTLFAAALLATPAFAAAPQTTPGASSAAGNPAGATSNYGDTNKAGPGQPTSGALTGQQAPVTAATVLSELHAANLSEQSVGEMATKQGQSKAVKDYGKMLMQDHAKADKQVMALAQKKGIDLNNQADTAKLKEEQAKAEPLKSATPAQFDKEFAQLMVDGHRDVINFAKNAEGRLGAADADVKKLLQDTLPTLEHHLKAAEAIRKQSQAH